VVFSVHDSYPICAKYFIAVRLQFDSMNIRDERTIGKQIRSGFRLAGWVLLTLALMLLVLGSTASLVGKGDHTKPIDRVLAGCVLLAISTLLFITVRRWAKWLIGALGYMIIKGAFGLLLGFTPSMPTITRPRLLFLQYLVVLVFAIVLCARYVTHAPRPPETVGLVGLVIALSFSVMCDSSLPVLAGATALGVIQLVHGRRQPKSNRIEAHG
jgi:hypothetical protein